MAFCLILVTSRTLSTLAIDQDEPLLLALFMLALGTAVLVPWSARWQGVLTLAGLLAFAIAAVDGCGRAGWISIDGWCWPPSEHSR